jgi:hypothetical protein
MRNLDMQTGLEKLQFTDDPHAVDAAAGERGSIAHARPWLVLVQDSDNDTVSGTDEETEELSNDETSDGEAQVPGWRAAGVGAFANETTRDCDEHMTEAPRFQVLPDDHDATCCDALSRSGSRRRTPGDQPGRRQCKCKKPAYATLRKSSLLIKVDHHNAGQVLHIETECATTHDSELVLDLSLCEVRSAPKRTLLALLVIMHLDLDCTLAVQ